MRSIRNAKVKGKIVLLRVDFDVPLDQRGKVADDFRMRMALPTIQILSRKGANLVLISKLGRPDGQDKNLSLKPVGQHFAKLTKRKVFFSPAHPKDLFPIVRCLPPRGILLLENIRFFKGETSNNPSFAKTLSQLGDLYVNDAFAVSHRKEASVVGITRYLPSFAGLRLEKEVKVLSRVKGNVARPFGVIIGGAKIEDKLPVIEKFLKKADWVFVGGGVANTFLWAKGFKVGKSLKDRKYLKMSQKLLKNKKLILPVDWLAAKDPGSRSPSYYFSKDIKENEAIFDMGMASIALLDEKIRESKTILWNGPVGVAENQNFTQGSHAIAYAISESPKAFSVVGGGDTIEVIHELGLKNKFSFISTGGGAMLEFLAGKKLPGIEALK